LKTVLLLTNSPPNKIAGNVIKLEIAEPVSILSTLALTMNPKPAEHYPTNMSTTYIDQNVVIEL
jgi:hypothetical protein